MCCNQIRLDKYAQEFVANQKGTACYLVIILSNLKGLEAEAVKVDREVSQAVLWSPWGIKEFQKKQAILEGSRMLLKS